MNEHIALILSLGLDVYLPDLPEPRQTWCYYTDGKHIGYAQWSDYRPRVSSVHRQSRQVGTGYIIADDITEASVREALQCVAPHWASPRDAAAVVKYRSFADFQASHWCTLVKVEREA